MKINSACRELLYGFVAKSIDAHSNFTATCKFCDAVVCLDAKARMVGDLHHAPACIVKRALAHLSAPIINVVQITKELPTKRHPTTREETVVNMRRNPSVKAMMERLLPLEILAREYPELYP